ncbi:acetyl esterase [Planctomycetes bacterium Pan216]|uniref:Acetyl esterase n=1 Tax=Kolteria novifilia TaxID=2527975 RepID=A0A518B1C1_9BACT|nr:acetyl esterase [Planctomycetes bacterium Pan216]
MVDTVRRFGLLLGLSVTLGIISPACAASKPTPTKANVPYGPHPKQQLDFYQAESDEPTPVLFFVHGGGWRGGDKARVLFLDQCLKNGISVVSTNYRLIPDVKEDTSQPPVKYCLDDAARALQFVRSKADEWNIDKTRIGACGSSAGGFTSLWLAFHPEMADPKSDDPISRESTRLSCAVVRGPQTSLDPKQLREWLPTFHYGPHAFNLPNFQTFLDKREELMPWIKEFSPYELATSDDPPVYLYFVDEPKMGQAVKDPVHSANLGLGLSQKLDDVGVEYVLKHRGTKDAKQPDQISFLKQHLKPEEK